MNLKTKKESPFWQKCFNLLVDVCLFFIRKEDYSNAFLHLIFFQSDEDFKIEDDGYNLNKCLNLILETLGLHTYTKLDSDKIDYFERALSERYYNSYIQQRLKYCLKLIGVITQNFQLNLSNFKITSLNQTLYLLSFLKHQIECISDQQTDPEMFTLEILFFNYTKRLIEMKYKIVFDYFFLIKHELYGFRGYVEKNVLKADYAIKEFKFETLICLESVKESLNNVSHMYMLLKLIDELNDSIYAHRVEQLFWDLFEKLEFDKKVSLVYEVYDKFELGFDQNNSLICLVNTQFASDLTLTINQISNKIDQNNLVRSLYVHFI